MFLNSKTIFKGKNARITTIYITHHLDLCGSISLLLTILHIANWDKSCLNHCDPNIFLFFKMVGSTMTHQIEESEVHRRTSSPFPRLFTGGNRPLCVCIIYIYIYYSLLHYSIYNIKASQKEKRVYLYLYNRSVQILYFYFQ